MSSRFIFLLSLSTLTILTACTQSGEETVSTPSSSVDSSVSTTASSTQSSPTLTEKTLTYSTHHGRKRISTHFSVRLGKDEIITSVKADLISGDHESARYHTRFVQAAQTQIIGKKLSDLSLDVVGGASDTTDAFREAFSLR